MEKDQKPIVRAMIRTSYREPLEKVIGYYLSQQITKILETVKLDGVRMPRDSLLRKPVVEAILKNPQTKKHLIDSIDELNPQDVCSEMLRQYGLHKGSESTDIHDELLKFYLEVKCDVKNELIRM